MTEEKNKTHRLFKVAKELNVGSSTLTEFLRSKGIEIDDKNPNEKISTEVYELLKLEYSSEKKLKAKDKSGKKTIFTKESKMAFIPLADPTPAETPSTIATTPLVFDLEEVSDSSKEIEPSNTSVPPLEPLPLVLEEIDFSSVPDIITTPKTKLGKSKKETKATKKVSGEIAPSSPLSEPSSPPLSTIEPLKVEDTTLTLANKGSTNTAEEIKVSSEPKVEENKIFHTREIDNTFELTQTIIAPAAFSPEIESVTDTPEQLQSVNLALTTPKLEKTTLEEEPIAPEADSFSPTSSPGTKQVQTVSATDQPFLEINIKSESISKQAPEIPFLQEKEIETTPPITLSTDLLPASSQEKAESNAPISNQNTIGLAPEKVDLLSTTNSLLSPTVQAPIEEKISVPSSLPDSPAALIKEQEKTTEVNTLARKLDSELEDSPVKKNEFSDVLSVSEKVKEQIQPTESIFTTEVTTLEKTDITSIPIQEESSTKVEEKNSLTSEAQEVAPSIQQDTSSTPKDFVIRAKDHAPKLQGLTIKGKIELPPPKPKKSHSLATKESTKIKEKETTKETARESIQGAAAIAGAKITSKTQETTPSQEIPEISIAVEKIELPAESLPTVKIEATEVSPTTASEASVAAPQEKELGEKKRRRKRKRKRKSSSETSALQNTPSLQSTSSTKVAPGTSTKKPALGKNKLQGIPATKPKEEISSREIQEKIKSTLAEMHKTASRKRQITRKEKRNKKASILEQQELEKIASSNVLEVTEFLTANELATLMNVSVNEVIKKCMELGLFVSINQRIDADVISLIAEEFGYQVKFISIEESFYQETKTVNEAELQERHPIVTVMGHVDHGKTSLLDYIRRTNVIAGEAGGITQHIGAYEVTLDNGKKITFLDTPGHEAFTAMRARGAQITDIAIIVIAADDQVMPQTKEAIHHAQAAGVPMVFAINKIDKPGANPEKIKEQLAQMNILVEEWGGKYQCQEISAKYGKNVNELLEKVLLEAELLELKANPNAPGRGTILEAQLDKGRGVVATILVQDGTCKVGDIMLANTTYGRIKAMFDERNRKVKSAGPSTPVQVLGLDGLPQAGDKFQIMESEKEARALAAKRQQLLREQSLRMQKRVTLEEISRRSAHGGKFKELNLIVKGDVDGSVEALSDSLIKLSTEEVAVKIIMKGVGQISESDVLLASASDAIIVGFQVRPSPGARKLAQQEAIDIRLYSVIYDAINEIKGALEGMLAPTIIEEVTGVAEVRELFKISKIGTVAGCLVSDGKITRGASVRLIREGIVIYTGKIASLKRFKEDAKEVTSGFECGISIENFNDLKVGDIIEAFTQTEVKRNLSS